MSAVSRPRRVNVPVVLLGAVLAVLGFLSALLLASSHGTPVPGTAGATASIVVAARDLPARTALSRADLATVNYALADLPPGAVTKLDSVVGMVAVADVRKGQPILDNLVIRNPEVLGAAAQPYLPLPKGFVALTLPAGEQQAVAGYIQAGDRIDVVAVVSLKGGASGVRTIYTNVPVLRIGPAPDDVAGGATGALRRGGLSSSITVAVNQCQAEYLSWFVTNASLRFTLLSSADYKDRQDLASDDQACGGNPKVINEADIRARWPGLA